MDFSIAIHQFFNIILFPPGVNFLLLLGAYFTFKKSRKVAFSLLSISVFSLYLLALPNVSHALYRSLQTQPALTQSQVNAYSNQERQDLAIVVLSAGRIRLAPEYGHIDTVSSQTLQRIQYAAWLQQKTKLPILLSGGSVYGEATAEAVLMNQTMLSAFNIAPKWIEFKSKNTAQNAEYSAKILQSNNIQQVLLVTHAIHMQRAKVEFEKTGLTVIPAPMGFHTQTSSWLALLPTAKALFESQQALHEKVGRFWYSLF